MKKIITTLGIVGTLFIGANLASANHLSGSYYIIPTYSSYTYTAGCNTYRYDPYYKTSTLISSTCSVSTYNSYNYGYSYPATTYSYSYPTTNYSYYNGYSNYGVSNYSPYDNYNYTYSNYGYNSNYYYNNTYSSYPYNYYGNSYNSSPTYQYWYNYTNGYPTSIQNVAPPIINWNSTNYSYGSNYTGCYYISGMQVCQ